jgi:hypothetical protein
MKLLSLGEKSTESVSRGADVILGACAGYSARQVRPFVESLRRWYGGEAIFVSAHLPPDAKILLREHRITEAEIALGPPSANIQLRRYFEYREILQAWPDIARALLVDVRDVIFQDHPFALLPAGPLIAFLEDEKIGNCRFNTRWLETIYGPDRATELATRTISCSGTTGGTRAGLLRYLDLMCREIAAAEPKRLIGGDQAIHNRLLNGELPEAVLVPNRAGAVQSLHHQKELIFDSQGRLLNIDGRICPVVHQIDRHPRFFPLSRFLQEESELEMEMALNAAGN